ncbi:hypothetical protein [Natrinema ejinorense]|uniref:RiboL-PSP-HEPN domain-containing protein n=1 Tax=Natrinema ejinorense TaxID=373386 RepID=A0A2A5R0C8_9EURY|nr:hypothetical protein [Natrinema ejinorense]PCR92469.1 hypothetical protein CP557_19190 [Natrinema ejinorense]
MSNELDEQTIEPEEAERIEFSLILDIILDDAESFEEINIEDKDATRGTLSRLRLIKVAADAYKEVTEFEDEISMISDDLGDDAGAVAQKARNIQTSSDKLILLFSIASEMMQEYSAELLRDHMIVDEFKESNKTQDLLERDLNQTVREELLLRTGIIDEGLKSEMVHLRKFRNQLIHGDPVEALNKTPNELESEIERCLQTINELLEHSSENLSTELAITVETDNTES